MTELKTLKEIRWRSPEIKDRIELGILPQEYKCVDEWFVNSGRLRKEAIKWVKNIDEKRNKAELSVEVAELWGRRKCLMEFFNLTEEDLK